MLVAVRSFFLKHSEWVHATALLWIAFIFMKMSQQSSPSIFWGWVIALFLFSIPVLVFLVARHMLLVKRNWRYWIYWGATFIAYPTLLFLLHIDVHSLHFASPLFHSDINGEYAFVSLAVIFLFAELVIVRGNRSRSFSWNNQWIHELNVFKLALILVGVFCLFLLNSNNYFQNELDHMTGPQQIGMYLVCYLLLFAVYLSYYLYYALHHHLLYNGILKTRGLLPYLTGIFLVIVLVIPAHTQLIAHVPFLADLKMHTVGIAPDIYDDLHFGLPISVILISFPLIVTIEWYKQAKAMSDLEEQRSQTELRLLRQQINPHFFFNTLNNLYAMSLVQAKETPETIMQLSELMRYVIYKGKEEKVKLHQEIKYIQDYIDLQLIRIHKQMDLKFDHSNVDEQIEIPPLLFIILIENAFKHGIEPAGSAGQLHITLKEGSSELTFDCVNSKEPRTQKEPPGIGLSNLRKRLDILYPNKHELLLDDQGTSFRARLRITL